MQRNTINDDIEVSFIRPKKDDSGFVSLRTVDAWYIEDDINGDENKGFYITGFSNYDKFRVSVSISYEALKEMVAEIEVQLGVEPAPTFTTVNNHNCCRDD